MVVYPSVFMREDVGYSVFFPDLPGCQTQGDTVEEAVNMAQEALGAYIVACENNKLTVPPASSPLSVEYGDGCFVTLIAADLNRYRNNKSVNKTLTLPKWLNDEAEAKHAPFSRILQNGLKDWLNSD
jgi:predicted RNase H-like HicB family nuclease